MSFESEGGGGAGAKRRRVDEQGAQRKKTEAAPVVRISALPGDLRRRILTRLPLKDAIRSGALAQGWRDFWKSRWAEPTSCREIHLLPGENPRKVLESLESVPRCRLDRFSSVSDNEKLRQPHLKRFLAYAAECRVEDLHVEDRYCNGRLIFHLPLSSPLLAHLSLRNMNLFDMYYKGARPFYFLESIHLHSVSSGAKFSKFMALRPRLHTLDLRDCCCGRDHTLYGAEACTPLSLRRITVAECNYGGDQIVSSLFNDRATPRWTKMNNLQSLREIQLLILGMEMDNLTNIYLFLKACHCPNLERLFVQLPATSDVPLEDLVEEVRVTLPEDVLANLRMVKVMNFNWHRFGVQLVSLLLRKATSLQKLLLVSPNVNPQQVPGVKEADLFLLKEALAVGALWSASLTIQQLNHFILRSLSRFNCQSICDPIDHNI